MSSRRLDMTIMGTVQGVGFRYYAYRIANDLGLVGWVRNLPDGRVQLAAEGMPEPLERLVQDLSAGPSGASVSDVEVKWSEPSGKFQSFDIQ